MSKFGVYIIGVTACAAIIATTAPAATSTTASSQSVTRLDEALRALTTAQQAVPGSRAYDIETDRLRGRRVWEVKVARGVSRPFEFDIRADGRVVLRQQRSATIDADVRRSAQATITLQRALRTAARRAGSGTFHEAGIDRWRGQTVWEATFKQSRGREVEVKVDARTGRVLAVEVDD